MPNKPRNASTVYVRATRGSAANRFKLPARQRAERVEELIEAGLSDHLIAQLSRESIYTRVSAKRTRLAL